MSYKYEKLSYVFIQQPLTPSPFAEPHLFFKFYYNSNNTMTDPSSIELILGKLDQLTQSNLLLEERLNMIQHQQNKRGRSQMETERAEMERSIPAARHTLEEAEERLNKFKACESAGFKSKLHIFSRVFYDDVW